jgi:hypothetical protein
LSGPSPDYAHVRAQTTPSGRRPLPYWIPHQNRLPTSVRQQPHNDPQMRQCAKDQAGKNTNVRVEPPNFWAFSISILVERLSHSSSTFARRPERSWNAVTSTTDAGTFVPVAVVTGHPYTAMRPPARGFRFLDRIRIGHDESWPSCLVEAPLAIGRFRRLRRRQEGLERCSVNYRHGELYLRCLPWRPACDQ